MAKLKKTYTEWINRVLGPETEFTIGNRILHAVCIITCVLALFALLVNLSLGLYHIGVLLTLLFFAHALFYYLSRIKKWHKIALSGVVLLAYAGVSVNYYLNDGINGPTLFVFYFTFQLLVAVTHKRYHWIFICLTSLMVLGLLFTEFHYPGWITSSYKEPLDRFKNEYVVFLLILIFVYLVIRSLLDSYFREKEKASQHAVELALRNEELERLTLEKEKLFSIVFHDLKSPLASIQIYLQAMAKINIDREQETRIKAELLRQTKETVANLDNMLLWVKNQVESSKPKLVPVAIRYLVEACVQIETPFAQSKKVMIEMEAEGEMMVMADDQMLQLLLRILINNAIKFTPEHALVSIGIYQERERCTVKVKDAGQGIPLENYAKIFTLNINATYGTNNEKGTGLGLMLAKQFADRQQIGIWFESKPGEGAAFFLGIPVTKESPEGPQDF